MAASDELNDDKEAIRFAVVMNGGVSLAIWMGGVTFELSRLIETDDAGRPRHPVYRALLDLTDSTARVDVIAGTSAGGLNGAFLALSTVYRTSLQPLSDLWADKGDLLDLMRPARAGDAPSLLMGDEYFLPELRKAFGAIASDQQVRAVPPTTPKKTPMVLLMTGTSITGLVRQFTDDFDSPIVEVEHKALFKFIRNASMSSDQFAQEKITDQLALAARTTASFPFAFEPSFVPIGTPGIDELHPDMKAVAPDIYASRFLMDGGVLMNKPIKPALDAVFRHSASGQVRRVLAYVVPDPGDPGSPGADVHTTPFGIGRVARDALMGLPRAQSIADELRELREYNQNVRDARSARIDLLAHLGGQGTIDLSREVFAAYRVRRARRAIAHVADIIGRVVKVGGPASAPWSNEELLTAFAAEGNVLLGTMPFVPKSPDPAAVGTRAWDWGLAPAERSVAVAIDVLRRTLAIAPQDEGFADARADIRSGKLRLYAILDKLEESRRLDTIFWESQASRINLPPPEKEKRAAALRAWATKALSEWPIAGGAGATKNDRSERVNALRDQTFEIAEVLTEVAGSLANVVSEQFFKASPDISAEARNLLTELIGLGVAGPSELEAPSVTRNSESIAIDAANLGVETVLQRLFALEVVRLAVSDGRQPLGSEVSLLLISGAAPNGFQKPALAVEQKLTGTQFHHFGAFYKRSWRINDWTWGRVDGASKLVEALLSPKRLRQLQTRVRAPGTPPITTQNIVDTIRAIACPDGLLADEWEMDEGQIKAELAFLDSQVSPLPKSLPVTARAVARVLQHEALEEELPRLAEAARYDVSKGGVRGTGIEFADRFERSGLGTIPPAKAATKRLRLFAGANIARETLAGEAGSDLFTTTVSRAAAVASSTLSAKGNGLGPIRTVGRAIRGVVLTIYAMAVAGKRGGSGQRAVTALFAIGGALIAVGVLTDSAPGPVKALGTLIVVATIGYLMLRSGLWAAGLLIALPLVAVIAVAFNRDGFTRVVDNLATILTVVAIVVGFMAIGSARAPRRRPIPADDRLRVALLLVALVAIVFAFYNAFTSGAMRRVLYAGVAFTYGSARDEVGIWKQSPGLSPASGMLIWLLVLVIAVSFVLAMWVSSVSDTHLRADRRDEARVAAGISWLPHFAVVLSALATGGLLVQMHRPEWFARKLSPFFAATAQAIPPLVWLCTTTALLFLCLAFATGLHGALVAWRRKPPPA